MPDEVHSLRVRSVENLQQDFEKIEDVAVGFVGVVVLVVVAVVVVAEGAGKSVHSKVVDTFL
jgi:heme/copper-type cytochrome/quinol oxidase subunit 4